MDKTSRKFNSFEEMKDEEYRYWQSLTPAERFWPSNERRGLSSLWLFRRWSRT